jgi:hypothetical protein
MSDLSQLKTLANMLRPLGEMISLVEKAESAEQAVRSAKVALAKIDQERITTASKVDTLESKALEVEAAIAVREKETAAKCEIMLAEAKTKIDADLTKLSDFTASQRAKADEMILAAQARVKTIDASIAEKIKEESRLEGKIEKLKADLRRLLASAEQ